MLAFQPPRWTPYPRYLPPPELAGADGLVAIGGSVTPAWLWDAYSHGIFAWPLENELTWWCPDPRAVLELDQLYISRRLARTCRSGRFELTVNQAFEEVIRWCAEAPDRQGETWLVPWFRQAMIRFHRLGFAHSLEVWHQGELVGGVYGVGIGAAFAAESMFHLTRDASKVALVYLVNHLRRRGYEILDIQMLTPHTQRMGGREIPRREFLRRWYRAVAQPVSFGKRLETAPVVASRHRLRESGADQNSS